MDVRVNMPFHQLLALVRSLSARQRAQLRAELDRVAESAEKNDPEFLALLAGGPVYTASELERVEQNRESIRQWRQTR